MMLRWWTIGRASGVGATAALAALLLWPFYRGRPELLEWPFALAAAVAGVCGASILAITAFDMLFHRRGARIRPVRGFDLVLGLGLLLLALLQMDDVRGGGGF
jgi:hypothetical protein